MEDNEGAMKLVKHASYRTRDFDVNYHIIRDTIEQGKVRVIYVDILTKPQDLKTLPSTRRL